MNRMPSRSHRGLGATFLAVACALYAFLPLSGCDGGTSSEVGNPSLTLNFRKRWLELFDQ